MNDEQKGTPIEKPVRALLEDITTTSETSGVQPRGLAPLKLVDRVAFFASISSLALIIGVFLGMIWSLIDPLLGCRLIGTILVVLAGLFLFRAINAQFD